jgi:hypothetical protein
MSAVVANIAPSLKAEGFKKRRHSFNRTTEPGVTQVVHFQMGPSDPPGTTYFPPVRVNLYGKFTLNLGVFLDDVHYALGTGPVPAWINEYDCQLRQRIGLLLPAREDTWWSLDDVDAASAVVGDALGGYGFAWLDGVRTRHAIVSRYDLAGRSASVCRQPHRS